MIRSIARRLRSDDSGISLVELLVTAFLTVMIMVMAGNMFIQTAKITTQSTQTNNSNNVASDIANEVTGVIRVATNLAVSGQPAPSAAVFATSTKESLTIYSLSSLDPSNPAPARVRFWITSATPPPGVTPRQVVEERCTATAVNGFWTFGSCGTLTTRYLGGVVQPNADGVNDQFFTYYDAANHPIVIGDGQLDAQAVNVASIKVYVSVKASGSDTKKVVISNTVFMGNLGLDQSEE